MRENIDGGEEERGDEELRGRGEGASDGLPNMPLVTGVIVPDLSGIFVDGRCLASVAAFRSKFVVPDAFVDPERAEQTMVTLC